MFRTRYGRKGGEGCFGINRFFGGGGSSGPAFRAGFFVNICSEEGR